MLLTLESSGLHITQSSVREPPRETIKACNTENKSILPKTEELVLCIILASDSCSNRKQHWTPCRSTQIGRRSWRSQLDTLSRLPYQASCRLRIGIEQVIQVLRSHLSPEQSYAKVASAGF